MARVATLVLCETVQPMITQNANGSVDIRPNIISPFISLQPIAIPGNYSFAIFFSICDIMFDPEKGQPNLQLMITAPNGEMIFNSAAIPVPTDVLSSGELTYSIDFRNYVFSQEGKYVIDILYNDDNLIKREFNVNRKEM